MYRTLDSHQTLTFFDLTASAAVCWAAYPNATKSRKWTKRRGQWKVRTETVGSSRFCPPCFVLECAWDLRSASFSYRGQRSGQPNKTARRTYLLEHF